MVGAVRADEHMADAEIKFLQLLDFDVAGQPRERHGEIGAFHLAGERGDEAFARALAAEDAQPAAGLVDRRKKRKALDVVPVRVRKEQRKIERAAL